MDRDTKANAREKLRKMDKNIAYPEELLDQHEVDGYFKDLEVSEDDYLGNELAISR